MLSAAFSLLALAGSAPARSLASEEPGLHGLRARTSNLHVPLAWAMEIVAFASSLFAVVAVLAAGTNAAALGSWGTTAGVGVILGAALLHILLVPRWQAEWLVYLAQAVMLLCVRRLPAGLPAIDGF